MQAFHSEEMRYTDTNLTQSNWRQSSNKDQRSHLSTLIKSFLLILGFISGGIFLAKKNLAPKTEKMRVHKFQLALLWPKNTSFAFCNVRSYFMQRFKKVYYLKQRITCHFYTRKKEFGFTKHLPRTEYLVHYGRRISTGFDPVKL